MSIKVDVVKRGYGGDIESILDGHDISTPNGAEVCKLKVMQALVQSISPETIDVKMYVQDTSMSFTKKNDDLYAVESGSLIHGDLGNLMVYFNEVVRAIKTTVKEV